MADHDELVKELRAAVAECLETDGPISLERLSAEQRFRQVGNAVPPILAEWAWRHVIEHEETP